MGVALTVDDGPDPRWTPAMLERIVGDLVPEAVILMHDGIGPRSASATGALRSSCQATVELVAPLVAEIRRRGLEPSLIA